MLSHYINRWSYFNLSMFLVVFAYTLYIAFIYCNQRLMCVSFSFLFQVKMYKSYVYGSMTFHKIKNEVYVHVINIHIKKSRNSLYQFPVITYPLLLPHWTRVTTGLTPNTRDSFYLPPVSTLYLLTPAVYIKYLQN